MCARILSGKIEVAIEIRCVYPVSSAYSRCLQIGDLDGKKWKSQIPWGLKIPWGAKMRRQPSLGGPRAAKMRRQPSLGGPRAAKIPEGSEDAAAAVPRRARGAVAEFEWFCRSLLSYSACVLRDLNRRTGRPGGDVYVPFHAWPTVLSRFACHCVGVLRPSPLW
jgi:hypothetical protein